MSFAESDCGIKEAHWHTGELTEGYFIEYWCPTLSAWTPDGHSFGNECSCEVTHTRARIQHTITEIIDILPAEPEEKNEDDFIEWMREQLLERFEYFFFYGEDAYKEKYGGSNEQ